MVADFLDVEAAAPAELVVPFVSVDSSLLAGFFPGLGVTAGESTLVDTRTSTPLIVMVVLKVEGLTPLVDFSAIPPADAAAVVVVQVDSSPEQLTPRSELATLGLAGSAELMGDGRKGLGFALLLAAAGIATG